MKYKRLTERVGKGVAIKETSRNDNMSIWNAIHRLAELEDKIEQGTLIELPCKVGDTMYKLCSVNSKIQMGQMWDGRIVKRNCDRCAYMLCPCYDIGLRERDNPLFIDVIEEIKINSLEFAVKIKPYVGTIWFITREEAEARLKEVQ